MSVLWMGANPGLRLFDGDRLTAWGGLCQVEWSERGAGDALILRCDRRTRVLSTNLDLATWIVETFVAPMTRSPSAITPDGVTWDPVAYEHTEVVCRTDLNTGLLARAGDIEIAMSDPLDRQLIYRDAYTIEGETYRVSFVNVPCAVGTILVGGASIPGRPRRWTDESGRLRSTAQIAVAEVWSR